MSKKTGFKIVRKLDDERLVSEYSDQILDEFPSCPEMLGEYFEGKWNANSPLLPYFIYTDEDLALSPLDPCVDTEFTPTLYRCEYEEPEDETLDSLRDKILTLDFYDADFSQCDDIEKVYDEIVDQDPQPGGPYTHNLSGKLAKRVKLLDMITAQDYIDFLEDFISVYGHNYTEDQINFMRTKIEFARELIN